MHHLRELRRYTMLPTLWKYSTPRISLRSFNTSPRTPISSPSSKSPLSTASTSQEQPSPQRYAIIGGGVAGVAVAWHLIKHSSQEKPIQIQLYDAHGLGAGGSGAAAGLLHPYTPRGKLLWEGLPAFQASLDLVNAAEDATLEKSTKRKQFVWRNGLLRPARTAKQAKDFARYNSKKETSSSVCDAKSIKTYEELIKLVPGLDPNLLFPENRGTIGEVEAAVGFLVEQAVVINPHDYLLALWECCILHARTSSPLASAQLRQNRTILSLSQLERQDGPFDGMVVAAGAAVDSIVETAGVLDLDLCQGYTLDMELPTETEQKQQERNELENLKLSFAFPSGAPGLLGSPYISPQGTHKAVVGATQRHECSLEDAIAALGPGSLQEKHSHEWKFAVGALIPAAAHLWPPLGAGFTSDTPTPNKDCILSGRDSTWQVTAVRSGYRALPQRTAQGSIPYAGKLMKNSFDKNWWVVGGLGARGLVYHGWLGKLVAAGMVEKSDEELPSELKRWKEGKTTPTGRSI